jgi:hypothetical protein
MLEYVPTSFDRRQCALDGCHLSRLLRRLDIPLKKSLIAMERDTLVQLGWRGAMTGIDPSRLVFSDGVRSS